MFITSKAPIFDFNTTVTMNRFLTSLYFLLCLSGGIFSQAQSPIALPPFPDGERMHPIQQSTINGTKTNGFWHFPSAYSVQMYEKTEWSLILGDKVMKAIEDFFKRNGAGKNGLNPFNPEDIDVWAEIWAPNATISRRINGFFYQEMDRVTTGDVNTWNWRELATPQPFRFRYAPQTAGVHYVKMFARTKNQGTFESEPFAFEATVNSATEGPLQITPNHRYFQQKDKSIFFPVGQNLLTAHFCTCENRSSNDPAGWKTEDCATCYTEGENDVCCNLNGEWRQEFWKSPHKDLRKRLEHPASFIKMLDEITRLKAAGGNAFRTILTPISYDFEFEKLNNYQDRQCMAWEFDKLLDKVDELDLRVELCMLLHTQFTHGFSASWDWTDLDQWNEGFGGYCYYTQRDKTNCDAEPASFFAQEEAKKYYKYKLRYFFARYGYSSEIIQLELLSEANNVGNRQGDPNNPEDWWGWLAKQLPESRSYNANARTRFDIGQWSEEMAKYIKNDLQQSHILASSYTGAAMMSDAFGKYPNCNDPLFDVSQMSPYIDVIAHSSYDTALDRWKKWADHDDAFNSVWFRYQCPAPNGKGKIKYRGYADVKKPALHSENGNDIGKNRDDQWFEKDMWCNLFSGHASAGMAWGMMYHNYRWEMFGKVNTFMHQIILPIADLANDTTWSVDWSEGGNRSPNARRMEMVYMKNNTPRKFCAFGILMNRTWNPATTTPPGLDADMKKSFITKWEPKFKDGIDGISFMPFIEIPYRYSTAPTIESMGKCNSYVITYYDPYTLQIIHRADDDVILGSGVRLKNFPALTAQRPYVLFTIVRNGNCFEN
ncbi:MAG: hypothetical protein RLZZ262_2648 [Bacteroidota bacterium]|jgi:hypothetical protein